MPWPKTKSSSRHSNWKSSNENDPSTRGNKSNKTQGVGRRNQWKMPAQTTSPEVTSQDAAPGWVNIDSGLDDVKASLDNAQNSWGNSQPTQADSPPLRGEWKPESGASQSWGSGDESESALVIECKDWGYDEVSYPEKTPEEKAEQERKKKLKAERSNLLEKLRDWPWKNAPPELIALV
jgi:hypothetical protein